MSEHSSASKDTQSPQTTHTPEIEAGAQGMASLTALGGQTLSFTNPDPDNVLKLQRTVGNQTTMQLMGQSNTKINRMLNLRMAGAIQREGEDEGVVDENPQNYDNPEPEGVKQKGMFEVQQDNIELPQYGGLSPEDNEEALDRLMGNAKSSIKFFLSLDDPRKVKTGLLDLMRMYYQGVYKANHPANKPEFIAKMESSDWSWITEASDLTELKTIHGLRNAFLNQEDIDKSAWEEFKQGSKGTASVASAGFTVLEGIETIQKIADNNSGGEDVFGSVMENIVLWISGKAFAGLAIGYDLIRAFGYHKKRRDGYKAALDRAGIDEKTNLADLEPGAMSDDQLAVAQVAQYAFKKTRRAFWYTIAKIVTKVVKWIMYTITMLSGGTTAAVTGAIAVGTDIVRVSTAAGLKFKGGIKALMGTKGKARAENSDELVKQASKGSEEAMRVIYDVDPFDGIKVASKFIQNFFGVKRETLPKPASFEIFVDEWDTKKKKRKADGKKRKGLYSTPEVRAALSSALKDTMKSQ